MTGPYSDHYRIEHPDTGGFKGKYLIVTSDDAEILEVFDTLGEAEKWLAEADEEKF